jgi:F-type H+-transporting ATPase subunit b
MITTVLAAEELNPLVPHWSEIIVGTIAFILLFLVLRKTAFPQFEKVYAERTDKIEGGLKRAEEAQQEANELKRQYEEQLAGLRAEAARIRDDARAEGQQIKAELRAQAEEEAPGSGNAVRSSSPRPASRPCASSAQRSVACRSSWPSA